MTRASGAALARAAEPQPEQRYSLRDAAKILEVPEARLRALARAGLLAPQRGPMGPLTFGFRDLLLLRTTKGLLDSGVPMKRIRQVWSSLREQLAADVPLTSVSIRADGEQVVVSDGSAAWRPDSGQFVLDFGAAEFAERTRAIAPRVATDEAPEPGAEAAERTADEWLELGLELESDDPEEAAAAYQRALELAPGLADAHVNLGRLYHLAGERGRAEAQYRDAVRLSPDDPVPHFNLGVLLEEQGRREEAAHAYLQAVSRDAEFADAHCNLGLLLESLGRRQEAARHLMAARDLYRTTE